jgi:hypothetical protein
MDGNVRSTPVMVARLYDYRMEVFRRYDQNYVEFYNKMVKKMCPHLQFNAETQRRIAEQKLANGIPDFTRTSNSVAFHVRRGDKLKQESRKFLGDEYVDKLQSVASNVTFDYCFVATDDDAAVEEIRVAIEKRNMTCQLYSFAQPSDHVTPATIQFIAELSIMISATYFVGSFNSNVGGLVTVLRGCKARDVPHYGRSYGVDREDWILF